MKDLSKIKCYNCHTIGHFVYQCHQRKRKEGNMRLMLKSSRRKRKEDRFDEDCKEYF